MLTNNPDGFFDRYLNKLYEGAEQEMYRAQARALSAMRLTPHIHAVFSDMPDTENPEPFVGSNDLQFHFYPLSGTTQQWYDWLMRTADMLDELGLAPEYSASGGYMELQWCYDAMHIIVNVWGPSPTCKAVTKTVTKEVTEWVCEG